MLLVPLLACAGRRSVPTARTSDLAIAESLYADLRDLRDRIDVALASDRTGITDATPLAAWIMGHNELRRSLAVRLAAIDSVGLSSGDRRALAVMRGTLVDIDTLSPPTAITESLPSPPNCGYNPRTIASRPNGLDSLRARVYACYGWSQSQIVVAGDTLDRLTILSRLGRTAHSAQRRRLFLALDPVWRSINGDNGPNSPYRVLEETAHQKQKGDLPSLVQVSASGVSPDSVEPWLLSMLETWRRANPDSLVEPWDWYYRMGQASRALSPSISRDRLIQVNDQMYRSLGANLKALRVRYDIEPREGKTPVAYATFRLRPRFINGSWRAGEPWVFATYRTGGLDNLNELLHETGHAIHIAAIRTRPALADWPDSDPFTEAVADLVALEVYEPIWQQRWLEDSVSLADGLRARYAGIVMDVAWALFELRIQRQAQADPNRVWTALTRDYLRIRPHPELSWWAMRGQLVHAPGYMMNYAVGAILSAALRARIIELHGSFSLGDSTWYGWIAPRLFRFGLERRSRKVIEDFLGGPVKPAAILADMQRLRE